MKFIIENCLQLDPLNYSSLESMVQAILTIGHVLNDMCASMWFTYLLLYFNKVLEFSNIYSGILMLIGQLADGFSTVFVGIFADKGIDLYLCNKLGQRKAWHLIGVVCVMASFPFIFSACPGCRLVQKLFYFESWIQTSTYYSFLKVLIFKDLLTLNVFFMYLVAHEFGHVKFWILDICCCFLQPGAVEISKQIFKIQNVQIY